MTPIFVGRESSNAGYHVYPRPRTLVTRTPAIDRVVAVTYDGRRWVEGERESLPIEAMQLVRAELARRSEAALRAAGRVMRTSSAWEAARACGVVATVYTDADQYVVIVREWSQWVGETDSEREDGRFSRLDDALAAAERACQTRPSFGDVERVS